MNTAMFIHSNSTIPWVQQGATFAWGTAPVPAGVAAASTVAGQDLVIFARATPEQQKAAWAFLKWLLSPEVNARFSVGTGYLPVRRSALDLPVLKEHVATAPEQYGAGIASLDRLVFDPSIPAWNDAASSRKPGQVLLTGADPEPPGCGGQVGAGDPRASDPPSAASRPHRGMKRCSLRLPGGRTRWRRVYTILRYAYVLPAFLILGAFHLWPSIYTFVLSLYDWNFIRPVPRCRLCQLPAAGGGRVLWTAAEHGGLRPQGGPGQHGPGVGTGPPADNRGFRYLPILLFTPVVTAPTPPGDLKYTTRGPTGSSTGSSG